MKVVRRNVRTCEILECTSGCRGTKQLGREYESSGWTTTSETWTDFVGSRLGVVQMAVKQARIAARGTLALRCVRLALSFAAAPCAL